MGKVITNFTMSLDGFIAEPNDEVRRLLRWYTSGDTEFPVAGTNMVFKVSRVSAEMLRDIWGKIGAFVTGRRDFDVSRAWGGQPLLGVPTLIVTHRVPQEWVTPGSPFTFVTEGVEHALKLARQAAGDKNIWLNGTKIVQQALRAGLVDEIHIDLAHMLLGEGIRLFDQLGSRPIDLEQIQIIEGIGVTHFDFRVVKQEGV